MCFYKSCDEAWHDGLWVLREILTAELCCMFSVRAKRSRRGDIGPSCFVVVIFGSLSLGWTQLVVVFSILFLGLQGRYRMGHFFVNRFFLAFGLLFLCECDGFFLFSSLFWSIKGRWNYLWGLSSQRQGDGWMDCFNWISSVCCVGWVREIEKLLR